MKLSPIFLLFFLYNISFAQNQNISNYSFGDMEPYIAVNPANNNNVIAAWMKVTGVQQTTIAVSYSNNGGANWSIPTNLPHLYPQFTHADVSIDFNSSGTAYICYIDYTLTQDSGYICVSSSTNGGQTWSNPVRAFSALETTDKNIDRPWLMVDRSSSQYNGRIYVTSKNVEDFVTTNHVYLKSSADGGLTWSAIKIIDDSIPCDLVTSMGCLAVGADGSVNVAYFSYNTQLSLFPRVILAKSTDGGSSFTPYQVALITGASVINDTLQGSMTLSANPTNSSNMVLTFIDGRNGDADVLCLKTNDGGFTWTTNPVRINDDALNNGNQQDMSWAGFSPSGMYCAAWRDRRNTGTSVLSPFEIYIAASWNGGSTFGTNYRISTVTSPDIPIQKGNDFIGISLSNNFVYTNWCDYRTANYEIFTNRDTLANVLGIKTIKQNKQIIVNAFPNPSSNEVNFSFFLNQDYSSATVYITDAIGKTLATLVNSPLYSGQQSLSFNVKKLAKGSYYLNLNLEGLISQKSFIVE
jgi:hypothetical protein